ncbi:MAG: ferritin family protein [Desulfobacterota bacterium]|jgi:rubrerythrin|nr:ferritin family protein [Thermodesulfobacteriota bacterium]
MFSLAEVYDLGIRIEKNGEKFYRDALKQAWSKPIAEMLKRLAEEEIKHVDFFAKRMDALKQKRENPFLDEMGSAMLKDILGNQTFSLKEADVSTMKSVDELVALAIEFEKDTILFYEIVGSFMADEESRRELKEIIEEEERHVRLFESYGEKEILLPRLNHKP